MKKIKLTGMFIIAFQCINAQINSNLQAYVKEVIYNQQQEASFISFNETPGVKESGLTGFIKAMIFNNGYNKVSVAKTERDDYGFTHIRYNILQNDVVLQNQVVIAHCRNGQLVSLNGELRIFNEPVNQYSLSEKSALAYALKKVNAKKYKWENKEEEYHMGNIYGKPGFSYYPLGSKTIFEKNGKLYRSYVFNIYAEEPLYRANVVVDAATGEILDEQNQICTINVPGTMATKYSGTQTVTIDQNGSVFRMRETIRGLGVETYNMNYTSTYAQNDFTSPSSNFTGVNPDQGARDAHWGAEKTYDYYFTQHNRNSIDNAGFKLVSFIHYQNNFTNAFWNGNCMTYGDGNGVSSTIFTALDICGHEMTHGLTQNSAGLIYNNEPGALNESFSDIFGTCIENYSRPTNWNWKIGEDMTPGGGALRNMAIPGGFGNPDTYNGQFWYVGTADNGGVHTNSGVSNFWFYLLTAGGSGTNDIGNAYSVSGIGITAAARIAFRALTVYFIPTTNYANARVLSLQAAKDLYGDCSFEYEQTARAWYAVGVGPNYAINVVGPDFLAPATNFCNVPATVSFSNITSNGTNFTWSFGDGGTSSAVNPTHLYTTAGSFIVKLKATGCGTAIDSITKPAFVVINIPSTPVVTNGVGCGTGPVTLSASANGLMNWYTSQFSASPVGTGATFQTPSLSSNAVFYVANAVANPPVLGGMLNFGTGGTANSPTQFLIFDVLQNSVLNSVVVKASAPGNRTIELRNGGNVIYSNTFSLTTGNNTLTLNYNLTPGSNYELGLDPNSTCFLYRSTNGINFPYNIGGCISITGSSSGNYYFWFYNWQVSKADCISPAVAVTASVLPAVISSVSVPKTVFCAGDAPVAITGSPAGGVFSGQNVSGSSFNPLVAGSSVVMYSYPDPSGCTVLSTVNMLVSNCTSIAASATNGQEVSVFPNPAADHVMIRNEAGTVRINLTDASGRSILIRQLETGEHSLNLADVAKGLYLLNIQDLSGKNLRTTKLLKD